MEEMTWRLRFVTVGGVTRCMCCHSRVEVEAGPWTHPQPCRPCRWCKPITMGSDDQIVLMPASLPPPPVFLVSDVQGNPDDVA